MNQDEQQKIWELTFSLQELGLMTGIEEYGVASVADLSEKDKGNYINPEKILPNAKSIIAVGMGIPDPLMRMETRIPGTIPNKFGSIGPLTIEFWLNELAQVLESRGYKTVIDKRPLSSMPTFRHNEVFQLAGGETEIGSRSVGGLAVGKNQLVVSKKYGSRILMGAMYTDAVLTPSEPFTENLCGDCTACIDACPSGALANGNYDKEKCIAYTSQPEHQLRLSDHSYVTCDMCMRVCPVGRTHWPEWGKSWGDILKHIGSGLSPKKP